MKLIQNYLKITGQRKLSFYEENMDNFNSASSWEPYYKNGLDYFKNTYINIVTETYFDFKKYDIHITEKSFKPFYYFQLPIFLAPPNHIKMMREEYDLDFSKPLQLWAKEVAFLDPVTGNDRHFISNQVLSIF